MLFHIGFQALSFFISKKQKKQKQKQTKQNKTKA